MGYIFTDDRASGDKLKERDTVQCRHCQWHVIKPLRKEDGKQYVEWCHSCGGPVCLKPQCRARCEPFMRKIEQAVARQAQKSAYGLALGLETTR